MEKVFQSSDPIKIAMEQDEEDSSDMCVLCTTDFRRRRNCTRYMGQSKTSPMHEKGKGK